MDSTNASKDEFSAPQRPKWFWIIGKHWRST